MSEPKETEPSAETQAGADVAPEGQAGAEPQADEQAELSGGGDAEPSAGEGTVATPKKKKKKARDTAEPETIRDRNARVRAEAAEKRRARREREQGTAPRRNLDASEVMDDALARSTHAAANFLTKHFNKVQWVIMVGLAGWIGVEVYTWRHARTTEKATDAVVKALVTEHGKVGGDEAPSADDRGGPTDTRPSFATDEERLRAAKRDYELASTTIPDPTSVIADMGAAWVAYDLGQYKDAEAAFEKVKKHAAYAADNDIKGRTLEGLGMSLEAQDKGDDALKSFRELANLDPASLSALGLYHQARLLKAQGKTDDALKLIEKAGSKLESLKETPAAIKYLGSAVLELLESIDPAKARELTKKLTPADTLQKAAAGAQGGGSKLSPEMQKKLEELMKNAAPSAPAAPALPGPVGPLKDLPDAPAPDAPAPAPSGAP